MGNLSGTPLLMQARIDKGNINEKSLKSLLEQDDDFCFNTESYRNDTLKLGFENEAERVSKEIYDKHSNLLTKLEFFGEDEDNDELQILGMMLNDLFEVPGFIGQSSNYGGYTYEIIETDFEYVVIIATVI